MPTFAITSTFTIRSVQPDKSNSVSTLSSHLGQTSYSTSSIAATISQESLRCLIPVSDTLLSTTSNMFTPIRTIFINHIRFYIQLQYSTPFCVF
ncbi:hypothetical protein TNCV_3666481, partial [Trichonephila clavipes]